MKDKAYKPKGSALDSLETFFAVVAFSEAGVFSTAYEFLDSIKPGCRDGYDYDEGLGLCVAKG